MTRWGGAVPAGERDEGRERRAARALVLVFIVLATGIIGASFLYYRSYEQRYRLEVERQLSAIAQLKVSELVQDRKERLGDAVVFYRNAAFSALARRYLENPQDAEAERPLRAWLKKVQEYYQYNRVSLLNARGEERMSVPNPQPIAAVLSRRVAEVLQSGQVGFQDFYRSEHHDQRIYLALLVPIFDEPEGGPALGVLALRIDPERYLYPYINRWPTPSRTAETLLVRRDGNDALFLNELRFQKNTALNLRVPSPYCGSGTTASASICSFTAGFSRCSSGCSGPRTIRGRGLGWRWCARRCGGWAGESGPRARRARARPSIWICRFRGQETGDRGQGTGDRAGL